MIISVTIEIRHFVPQFSELTHFVVNSSEWQVGLLSMPHASTGFSFGLHRTPLISPLLGATAKCTEGGWISNPGAGRCEIGL